MNSQNINELQAKLFEQYNSSNPNWDLIESLREEIAEKSKAKMAFQAQFKNNDNEEIALEAMNRHGF